MKHTFWLLFSLNGCAFISDENEKMRLDPDGDGIDWPNDCDDDNETIALHLILILMRMGMAMATPMQTQPRHVNWLKDMSCNDDCDDTNHGTSPMAVEICDNIDNQ